MASTAPAADRLARAAERLARAAERLARADVARFVAACYYEPGPLFDEERLFESLAAAAERVDPELGSAARALGKAFRAESLDALLVDYTRLFVGPSGVYVRPYSSEWADEADSAGLRAEAGVETSGDFHDRPDHIAVELELLYRLTYEERVGRERLLAHLSRWVPPFTEAVRWGAETSFYCELARLTDLVVRAEAG